MATVGQMRDALKAALRANEVDPKGPVDPTYAPWVKAALRCIHEPLTPKAADPGFSPVQAQAWQYLDEFVHGSLSASNLKTAKAALVVLGAWLDSMEA